jgi:predicted DNA-binding protein (MmcQ/YjbR family)
MIMAAIDQLRKYCLSLPAVTEDVKWENNLVFSVGDKMFCVAGLEQPLSFSFKVPDEDFEEISSRQGFKPAPYLARAKWVLATEPSRLHTNEWKQFIKTSYELVKNKLTKKTRTELKID